MHEKEAQRKRNCENPHAPLCVFLQQRKKGPGGSHKEKESVWEINDYGHGGALWATCVDV